MSLAEDLRRSFELTQPSPSSSRPATRRPAVLPPRNVPHTPRIVSSREEPVVASDDSLGLLDRAAKSIVFLLGRYRQLEEHVRQLDAWSKAQVQAAETAATRWQEASADAERKVHDMQKALDAAVRRADAAEQTVKRERDTLSALQARIAKAFGAGSEAHDALATLDMD